MVQDVEGEGRHLTRLSDTSLVCPPRARAMEPWLRSLLDWRPAHRGRDQADNVVVFTQFISLMHLNISF